jgi:hypothetical protein
MTETNQDTRKDTKFPVMPEMFSDMGLDSWSERIAAMGEAQTRTFKHLTEQAMGYGRQLGEHVNNQMQVTSKLYKDGLDYSINLWGAWNKVLLESTEHALDNLIPRK